MVIARPYTQWCQNNASKMMIGNGTPISQSSKPLPKPMISSIAFYRLQEGTCE